MFSVSMCEVNDRTTLAAEERITIPLTERPTVKAQRDIGNNWK